MFLQRTIRSEISCRGVGLHTGRKISMTLRPAAAGEGIVFVRKDLPSDRNCVRASLENVRDTMLATTIGANGTLVATVEHLLSALGGMGVDNALIELDGPEVPIMDGSALPFVKMLKDVGTSIQGRSKKLLLVKEPVTVSNNDGFAKLLPASELKISCRIDFPHRFIGVQPYQLTFSDVTYEHEICSARTFGFLKDVEYLQAQGLALGGSLQNVVVLDEDRIINKEGLRSPDEFVKHKILDVIGDLSLLGMPIIAHFVAYKPGHHLNIMLARELIARKECWEVLDHLVGEGELSERQPLNVPTFRTLDACPA